MPAIPYTKTDTSDAAWDGPANEKSLSNDESDLRAAFAWVDPEGDPTTKVAYKGIHHDVGDDGAVGAASAVACSSLIGILNGARGGIDVSAADKQGIYDHVAKHLTDAGKEAPELKAATHPTRRVILAGSARVGIQGERLERMTPGPVEIRAAKGGERTVYGHGATFNVMTQIDTWAGPYLEKVAAGCFAKTIQDGADVRCLFNHDPNYVLGRTKSQTLTLAEDTVGLAYEAMPPDTQWARDLCTSMDRGDIDGSSFGFRIIRDKWSTVMDPDGDQVNDIMDCRTLLEVQLYDVSPVTFPAYVESESALRSALLRGGFDLNAVYRVAHRFDSGLTLTPRDVDSVRAAIDYLRRYLPNESQQAASSAPVRTGHPPTPQPIAPTPPRHADDLLLERLSEMERSITE